MQTKCSWNFSSVSASVILLLFISVWILFHLQINFYKNSIKFTMTIFIFLNIKNIMSMHSGYNIFLVLFPMLTKFPCVDGSIYWIYVG